tara:strand:- start:116 stop:760 length:645 start_codon:yes stop_codon:yes gene_type:complete
MISIANSVKDKLDIIKENILDIQKINILELGVRKGNSTKMFLDVCERNDGYLTSIDIEDCSKVVNNKRWNFIHSSDSNFDYVNKFINNSKFDVLYIDSLHEPNHIRKVFYHYFNFLKLNGIIFLDDVVWLPYTKNAVRDNDFVERINRLTFEKLIEIYNANINNLTLNINFTGSGLAILKKIGSDLNTEKKIKNRLFSLKNIIKKYIYSPKPKL